MQDVQNNMDMEKQKGSFKYNKWIINYNHFRFNVDSIITNWVFNFIK